MQDEQQTRALRCDWEPCKKRLVDFCHVCDVTSKYYCDTICCDRDLQETQPRPSLSCVFNPA
jgi:hypothetical protein